MLIVVAPKLAVSGITVFALHSISSAVWRYWRCSYITWQRPHSWLSGTGRWKI